MEQTDIFYVAKYWEGSFNSLISGPWLDSFSANGIKDTLNASKTLNKESYEVVRQPIEFIKEENE